MYCFDDKHTSSRVVLQVHTPFRWGDRRSENVKARTELVTSACVRHTWRKQDGSFEQEHHQWNLVPLAKMLQEEGHTLPASETTWQWNAPGSIPPAERTEGHGTRALRRYDDVRRTIQLGESLCFDDYDTVYMNKLAKTAMRRGLEEEYEVVAVGTSSSRAGLRCSTSSFRTVAVSERELGAEDDYSLPAPPTVPQMRCISLQCGPPESTSPAARSVGFPKAVPPWAGQQPAAPLTISGVPLGLMGAGGSFGAAQQPAASSHVIPVNNHYQPPGGRINLSGNNMFGRGIFSRGLQLAMELPPPQVKNPFRIFSTQSSRAPERPELCRSVFGSAAKSPLMGIAMALSIPAHESSSRNPPFPARSLLRAVLVRRT